MFARHIVGPADFLFHGKRYAFAIGDLQPAPTATSRGESECHGKPLYYLQ
jgi:hypothetical protein